MNDYFDNQYAHRYVLFMNYFGLLYKNNPNYWDLFRKMEFYARNVYMWLNQTTSLNIYCRFTGLCEAGLKVEIKKNLVV